MRNFSFLTFAPWLLLFTLFFVIFLVIKKYFFSKTPAESANSSLDSEIMKHSSDRLNNGDTYWSACQWLYENVLGGAWFSILKNVDEERVGNYMLSITRSEYKQLEATFKLYKEGQSFMYKSDSSTLLSYLRGCMNSSEQKKYLSQFDNL